MEHGSSELPPLQEQTVEANSASSGCAAPVQWRVKQVLERNLWKHVLPNRAHGRPVLPIHAEERWGCRKCKDPKSEQLVSCGVTRTWKNVVDAACMHGIYTRESINIAGVVLWYASTGIDRDGEVILVMRGVDVSRCLQEQS